MTDAEKKTLQPEPWESLPNGFFVPDTGKYAHNVAKVLARLFSRRGIGFYEPADTLDISLRKLARKMGLRYVRDTDWMLFWHTVAYQIVILDLTPAAPRLAAETRRIVAQPSPTYAPRYTYLLRATRSVVEQERLQQIFMIILAAAAFDADRRNIDRPTWFAELQAWRDAILAARFSMVKPPSSEYLLPQDNGFSAEIAGMRISVDEQQVYIDNKEYTPDEITHLGLALLEAAQLAMKSAS